MMHICVTRPQWVEFDRYLGSIAAKASVEFQNDTVTSWHNFLGFFLDVRWGISVIETLRWASPRAPKCAWNWQESRGRNTFLRRLCCGNLSNKRLQAWDLYISLQKSWLFLIISVQMAWKWAVMWVTYTVPISIFFSSQPIGFFFHSYVCNFFVLGMIGLIIGSNSWEQELPSHAA